MKVCPTCSSSKSPTEFYASARNADGLQGECKKCMTVRARQWREDNRERYTEYQREHSLQRRYGIGIAGYEALWIEQGGRCTLCGAMEADATGRRLHVDHDKKTGAVRSLLCKACNTGIGLLGHSAKRLRTAATYIEQHERAYSV